MSTMHVYLNGGPMHGAINTEQDPGQQLRYLVDIEETPEGPKACYAKYVFWKSEPAPKPLRGEFGVYTHIGNEWEDIEDE